jgi:hypothetical protein
MIESYDSDMGIEIRRTMREGKGAFFDAGGDLLHFLATGKVSLGEKLNDGVWDREYAAGGF